MQVRLASLSGHLVVFEAIFSLPVLLFFLWQIHQQGTLTLSWGLYLFVLWASLGAIGGAFFWYAVSRPLIRRRSE